MTKDEIIEVLRWNPERLQYASKSVRSHKEIMHAVIDWEPWAIQYADDCLRDDEETGLLVVKNLPGCIQYLSNRLQNMPSIVQACLDASPSGPFLKWVPEAYQKDYEFVLKAVGKTGSDLAFVSEELQKDKTIVRAAVENAPVAAIQHVHKDLSGDEEFMEELFQKSPAIFPHMSSESRLNRKNVLRALRHDGKFYESLTSSQKVDHEIIQLALDSEPFAIEWVPEQQLIEGEYWKLTIPKYPGTYHKLPLTLQKRVDIASFLVQIALHEFYSLSEELQSNPKVLEEKRKAEEKKFGRSF